MPTLWKHPESKYWFAKITLPDGRRTSRTTKQTDRRAALQVAFTMERAASMARRNELTQSAVIKLARDLCDAVGAAPIETKSIADYFTEHLDRRKITGCSLGTLSRYRPIVTGFLAHLGAARSSSFLASLSANEIEGFRNAEIASGKARTTADFAVKVLRGALNDAKRKDIILHNPAEAVVLTGADAQEREPFIDGAAGRYFVREYLDTNRAPKLFFDSGTGTSLDLNPITIIGRKMVLGTRGDSQKPGSVVPEIANGPPTQMEFQLIQGIRPTGAGA